MFLAGHAFAAAISACAAGAQWRRAVSLFEEMTTHSIRPDVVSCTALITALASAGECDKADGVVAWMLSNSLKPNVRTYTALLTAMCNAQQWQRAVDVLDRMQQPAWGGVQPNAYSYSALLKSLGEFGQWQLAESVFGRIEAELLSDVIAPSGLTQRLPSSAAMSASDSGLFASTSILPPPPPPPRRDAATPALRANSQPGTAVPASSHEALLQAALSRTSANGGLHAPLPYNNNNTSINSTSSDNDLASTLTTTQLSALSIAAASSLFQATSTVSTNTPAVPTAASTSSTEQAPTVLTSAVLGAIGRGRRVPSSSASSASLHSRWTAAAELHGLSLEIERPLHAPIKEPPPRVLRSPIVPSLTVVSAPYVAPPSLPRPALPVFPDSEAPPSRTEAYRRTSEDEDLLGGLLAGRVAMQALEGNDNPSFSLFSGVSAAAAVTAARAPEGSSRRTGGVVPADSPWGLALDQMTGQLLSPAVTAPSTGSQFPRRVQQQGSAAPSLPSRTRPQQPPPPPTKQQQQTTAAAASAQEAKSGSSSSLSTLPHTSIVNEVVCGALMLAYERSGKWQETILMLQRSLALGITPNTIMYNTAISAAGKAGQLDIAGRLFAKVRRPDAVTYETMIAAFGMCGRSKDAEAMFMAMQAAGLRPRDYAYCGLIAAYSLSGDVESALRVRQRMRLDKTPATVYVYNALLAAAERAQQAGRGLELYAAMQREGVEPNAVTLQLLANVGRQGVATVESQQVTAAALTAAFAAAGTMLMQTGMF